MKTDLKVMVPNVAAKEQTKYLKDSVFSPSKPGTFITQIDNGDYIADYDGNDQYLTSIQVGRTEMKFRMWLREMSSCNCLFD